MNARTPPHPSPNRRQIADKSRRNRKSQTNREIAGASTTPPQIAKSLSQIAMRAPNSQRSQSQIAASRIADRVAAAWRSECHACMHRSHACRHNMRLSINVTKPFLGVIMVTIFFTICKYSLFYNIIKYFGHWPMFEMHNKLQK